MVRPDGSFLSRLNDDPPAACIPEAESKSENKNIPGISVVLDIEGNVTVTLENWKIQVRAQCSFTLGCTSHVFGAYLFAGVRDLTYRSSPIHPCWDLRPFDWRTRTPSLIRGRCQGCGYWSDIYPGHVVFPLLLTFGTSV
jgi:hypothetical protein